MKILDQSIPELIREQAAILKRRTDLTWSREAAELIYSDCILHACNNEWRLMTSPKYDEFGLCKAIFEFFSVGDIYEPLYEFIMECQAKKEPISSR